MLTLTARFSARGSALPPVSCGGGGVYGLGASTGGASLDIGSGQPGEGASRAAVFLQQITRWA